jgi:hypothetical protein
MSIFRRLTFILLPLAIPLAALAGQPAAALQSKNDLSPLVEKVRAATERYKNINVALNEGFAQATPCVSGPDFGAMGVHFVLGSRVSAGTLAADQPEALIYEPMAGGAFRFVGVEFIVLASVWTSLHPNAGPPALDGHLMNLVAAPNRYGLPEFYELHVWAWEQNPVGSFADWNTRVTCDKQPVD